MCNKIIFYDIDGTILDDHKMTESCKNAIKEAQSNGHLCIINTGRPYTTVPEIIKDFGFDGLICGCGTYISFNNQVIYQYELDETIRKETQDLLFSSDVDMVLEGSTDTCFINQVSSKGFIECYNEFSSQFPLHEYKEGELLNFDKMTLFFDINTDLTQLRNGLSKYFDIIERDPTFIEVVPKNHSKATGIDMLLKHIHMSTKDTFSIGDSPNDLTMLQHTAISIAMGNSKKEILPYVNYITDTIENDGIYKALQHYHLIK